jgi:hypothetical protein
METILNAVYQLSPIVAYDALQSMSTTDMVLLYLGAKAVILPIAAGLSFKEHVKFTRKLGSQG